MPFMTWTCSDCGVKAFGEAEYIQYVRNTHREQGCDTSLLDAPIIDPGHITPPKVDDVVMGFSKPFGGLWMDGKFMGEVTDVSFEAQEKQGLHYVPEKVEGTSYKPPNSYVMSSMFGAMDFAKEFIDSNYVTPCNHAPPFSASLKNHGKVLVISCTYCPYVLTITRKHRRWRAGNAATWANMYGWAHTEMFHAEQDMLHRFGLTKDSPKPTFDKKMELPEIKGRVQMLEDSHEWGS